MTYAKSKYKSFTVDFFLILLHVFFVFVFSFKYHEELKQFTIS